MQTSKYAEIYTTENTNRATHNNGQRSGSRYESHSRLDTGSTSVAPSTDEGRLRRNAAHLALPGRTTGCSGGEKRTSLTSVSPMAECHRQRRRSSTATAEPESQILDGNDLQCAHHLAFFLHRGPHGNWTTRGYANSRIANSRTGHLADWTSRGLDNSRMSPVVVVVLSR